MSTTYPVHVDAELDTRLSRWLWLVKWLLVLPHYVVLFFLWLAFAVLSVVAFFGILFTGRYPRSIFEFNVGVLRWSWRVAYYAYGALGTDRYPPFTLHEVPDYPAHFEVEYPEHLSRGLVLVKWWLLAIPHYIVVGLLVGGTGYAVQSGNDQSFVWGAGLIGLLVCVAGVLLLFTGRYPQGLFDLVLGLNRWVLRVAGYAGLMTDKYPPFSLEQGGHESGGSATLVAPPPAPAPPAPAPAPTPPATTPAPPSATAPTPPPPSQPPPASQPPPPSQPPPAFQPPPPSGPGAAHTSAWTAGRVISLVLGCLFVLMSVGLGLPAAALVAADLGARDDAGFLMSNSHTISTPTYAMTSSNLSLHVTAPPAFMPDSVLGDTKLTATGRAGQATFIGIAPTSQVRAYLAGVQYERLTDIRDGSPVFADHPGQAPAVPPDQAGIWTVRSSGTGTQSIVWAPENGDWTVVVMNSDGSQGVTVAATAGAEVPAIGWVIGIMLVLAGAALLVGIVLITVPLRSVSRQSSRT